LQANIIVFISIMQNEDILSLYLDSSRNKDNNEFIILKLFILK